MLGNLTSAERAQLHDLLAKALDGQDASLDVVCSD